MIYFYSYSYISFLYKNGLFINIAWEISFEKRNKENFWYGK